MTDNKWISVKEKLPEKEGYYLCLIRGCPCCKEPSLKPKLQWFNRNYDKKYYLDVAYWMPFPDYNYLLKTEPYVDIYGVNKS